jgi:16S rRNA (adenine1518-N6/adenine1519-N6)-dimethyltransferase
MRLKKSFGQHFLHREDIAEKIANSLIHTDQYQLIVEVGPGSGMMTKYLIEKPQNFIAIEADRDLIMPLAMNFPTLNVIHQDFLKVKLDEVTTGQFALIGNYPYNISSQILFKMMDYRHLIPEMVGMFQKEVAERVIAPPNSKVYGVISVLMQAYYNGEYLFTVDKGAFNPPPKVQSGVIRLVRKDIDQIACDYSLFKSIVKTTFGQRRKMLRSTMKQFLKDSEVLKDDFFDQRPENLSVQDFIDLTLRVQEELRIKN